MRKYILACLLILALAVLFFRSDKKLDLGGDWTVRSLVINNKDLLANTDTTTATTFKPKIDFDEFFVERSAFRLQSINLFDFNDRGIIKGKINIISNDTLILSRSSYGLLDSKYHIKVDTILYEKLSPLERDVNVILTSDTIMINLYKHEIVGERNRMLREMNNSKRIERGRP